MKSTIYLTDLERARQKNSLAPKSDCLFSGEASGGEESITTPVRRQIVQRWQRFSLNNEGRMVRHTVGRIPDLGCFTISTVEEVQNPDGSFSKRSEQRNDGLVEGEPLASDFDVPDAYEEVRPSVLLKSTRYAAVYSILSSKVKGVTVVPAALERLERELALEDAAYDAHRK
jgi:hypothetical protein